MLGLPAGDLIWIGGAAVLAGLVRGFAGFGTALIYLPLASLSLSPIWALITLTVMDLIGPLPNVQRAWREGRPREVGLLVVAAAVTVLPGLWVLQAIGTLGFRWLVAAICLLTVAALVSGWRWTERMTRPRILAIGGTAGFFGGAAGLPGPPVILAYMAAPLPASSVRANVLLFLVAWDMLFGAVLFLSGHLDTAAVILGAALIPPYLIANITGAWLFRPHRERAYRILAYVLISASAVMAVTG